MLSRKLLRGVYGSYNLLLHERQKNIYICFSYYPCGTAYWDKVFSERMCCKSVLHYYTCMNSRDFPCETDNTRRNRQHVYFDESERC